MGSLPVNRPAIRSIFLLLALLLPSWLRGDAMLQYFSTDWAELTRRMPELAEVGYTSLWLPPSQKGSGGLSVGYDVWDRFDLGSKDQRGTVRTMYGTEGDLLELIETAHRFGIRVYLDNIVNHNAFDVPGYNESTPIDVYPGFVPEDFHLRRTSDGFYRKWDNTRDWNDSWQVQNLGLSDLIDIAHENANTNHGPNEGDDIPKIVFTRHPDNMEYYLDLNLPITVSNSGGSYTVFPFANKEPFSDVGYVDGGNVVGAGNGKFDFKDTNANGQHDAGELSESFTDTGTAPANPARQTAAWGYGNGRYDMGDPVAEDVNAMLIRSGRWVVDRTHCDGFRLDAVKHVPDYFFGQQSGSDKDRSSAGFLGQAQEQFNITRGFSDWENHRDSVFDSEIGRDDLMLFGEHLGAPPGFDGYFNAGMRLVDNPLRNELNSLLGNPSSGLQGYDQPGAGGFAPGLGVTHAQSHDSDYAARRELQHGYYFTRAGVPLIYTDGNNKAGLLEGSGGAFPRHANTNFLGQYGDNKIPNVVYLHNHFARGYQIGRWSDADFVAYERLDKRENGGMSDADGVTLLFMMNDNYGSGQARSLATSFPATAGGSDAYLYNYSRYGGGFYTYASALNSVVVPSGGYFAFSWRSPEQPNVFAGSEVAPITIRQSGAAVGTVAVTRKDGRDGDAAFNPYGLADTNTTDYQYTINLPRVTNGANLSFIARADGSAENMLMELDGGVDINSQIPLGPTAGDKRDNAPAVSTDTFLGYEQMQFVRRTAEKFAAQLTSRNVIGSPGAETWKATIGTGFLAPNLGGGTNSSTDTASYVYHNPALNRDGASATAQFTPQPAAAAGQAITVRVKTAYQFQVNFAWLYYTTDGSAPEGSGGVVKGTTKAVAMAFESAGADDGALHTDWWKATIPAQASGTVLRYKMGALSTGAFSVFPSGAVAVDLKKRMETVFQIANFNATTAKVRPHNDYGREVTGLAEGMHILRARAFLDRGGKASIYNTWTQAFYYDTQTPQGEIKFPTASETLGGSTYGGVVRTNRDVTEVWYNLTDSDATNDDAATGAQGGNGAGPEPFTDANGNGVRDGGEAFTDINGNGIFDANLAATWQRASEVTPSLTVSSAYPREWRFTYRNIPASGTATIKVRLFELSSQRNMSLPAAGAWVTELTRTVNTAGPNLRMFVAYPQQDAQTVGAGYGMKVRFTNTLGDGLSEETLRARLSVKIASSVSGENTGAVVQPAQALPIIYNSATGYHDFQFALPDLYNGNPEFLHSIEVTMTRPGNSALVATRLVKAAVTVPGPFVSIINPPEFDSDGKRYEIILPDVLTPTAQQRQFTIEVDTDSAAQAVSIVFTRGAGSATLVSDGTANPRIEGSHKFWRFLWSGMTAGTFTFEARVDTDGNTATTEAKDTRNATVIFRQIVVGNPADTDDDDDGLSDVAEQTITPFPSTDASTWTNGQVHIHFAYGQTSPTLVDSDGDRLPDGLEVGWATATDAGTNIATDTNGDGFPNFLGDTDAPLYNVTGNATRPAGYGQFSPWGYNANNGRVDQLAGTTTNPNKADTDDDGLMDGAEDFNRNGRVEIGLLDGTGAVTSLLAHPPTFYNTPRLDRTKLPANSVLLETDPNTADAEGDGLSDGNEDADRNARVSLVLADLDATVGGNFVVLGPLDDSDALGFGKFTEMTYSLGAYKSQRIRRSLLTAAYPKINPANGHLIGVLWLETDPCDVDTDGDGLPDGWEVANGLDPLDDGIAGHVSLRTGKPASPANGAAGDPDGDSFTNVQEYLNATDPHEPDTGVPPPANSIVIGTQAPVAVGSVVNAKEFTDWTADDLVALDEQDGEGANNGGGDLYHANDGFDTSRDIVAFYTHDGGDTGIGGDGNFYFRVDIAELQPLAEDGFLDIYVAVNVGNPGAGERNLPDDVDTLTTMGWQAVVACYSGNNGRVYVDANAAVNTATIGQSFTGTGVVARDQNTANGFKKAYYNSQLDCVEFSISRQALRDAGWNGLDAGDLIYQVFTTKDGTTNSPVGAGDLGGRTDIRDTIYDDYLASDYYGDQAGISGAGSKLQSYFGRNVGNDRGRSAKVVSLIHGSQAIQPGSSVQALINNSANGGYYRPLDVHQAYGVPLSMHLTPTLGSSIQWAAVDPLSPRQYRDGPALNARIHSLADAGTVSLLGSTFADHIIGYFPDAFNASSISLASEYLTSFYGSHVSSQVFWNPERVADGGLFAKVSTLGFSHTFIDQQRHVVKWFGRQSALGDDGYRLNSINGVKNFVINDNLAGLLYSNSDHGLPVSLRKLLLRKARSSTQDQVVVLFANWEDFADKAKADAYDGNIRWLASHPWVKIVTPDQIASGQVDLNIPPDGAGNTWGTVNRGTGLALGKVAHDFLDHATQETYDNWYNGQLNREESLRDKRFDIRPGTTLAAGKKFGTVGVDGVSQETWASITSMSALTGSLGKLARGTAFASVFETAFHTQTNNDLTKFSTGSYIYPDTSNQSLADFAKVAQSQMRNAAIYKRVETWGALASTYTTAIAEGSDVDLDGEAEYLLYNDRVFAIFEAIGGRMTGGWARDIENGSIIQLVGNPLSYAGLADEREGETNIAGGVVNTYRVSCFRDQFLQTAPPAAAGTTRYVNDLYAATNISAGAVAAWRFLSSDSVVQKTITLSPRSTVLRGDYSLGGPARIYVRFGASPNLTDLLLNGQAHLTHVIPATSANGSRQSVSNTVARASVFLRPGTATSFLNTAAVDRDSGVVFDTLNMRNLAQTEQMEGYGTGTTRLDLGLQVGATNTQDTDGDGLVDWWEIQNALNPNDATSANGPDGDPDGDGMSNLAEFLFGTAANIPQSGIGMSVTRPSASTAQLTFPTLLTRRYTVQWTNDLTQPWQNAGSLLGGTGSAMMWTDDGTQTGTAPSTQSRRFYRLQATPVAE